MCAPGKSRVVGRHIYILLVKASFDSCRSAQQWKEENLDEVELGDQRLGVDRRGNLSGSLQGERGVKRRRDGMRRLK
jgi:hypothetical protein